jgi:nitric oxide reductase subunit C
MIEGLTKAAARNIFYGGSLFFFLLFAALTVHSHFYIVNTSTDREGLTDSVKLGKKVWEKHNCINCHTILVEGAYFGPEIGNVWTRFGGHQSPEGARLVLAAWIRAQPSGVPGRRQMPYFEISDEEMDALIDFLQWTDAIDTQGWPPHPSG